MQNSHRVSTRITALPVNCLNFHSIELQAGKLSIWCQHLLYLRRFDSNERKGATAEGIKICLVNGLNERRKQLYGKVEIASFLFDKRLESSSLGLRHCREKFFVQIFFNIIPSINLRVIALQAHLEACRS